MFGQGPFRGRTLGKESLHEQAKLCVPVALAFVKMSPKKIGKNA